MAIYVPLSPVPLQFVDENSVVRSGDTLKFYLAGTSTPTNLFSDNIGTSIGPTIVLNSEGYPASGGNVITLFRDTSIDIKIELDDGTVVWTSDGLNSELDVFASTANGEGASLIGVEDAAANFTAANLEDVLAEIIADFASASNGDGASKVGVEDADGYFTGTDVEAVLAEFRALRQYVTKASDTSRASTTTLTNDDELTFAIPAAGTYRFMVHVIFDGNAAGTQGIDCNVNFSGTQGNGTRMLYQGDVNGSSVGHVNVAVAATTSAVTFTAGDVDATNYSNSLIFEGVLIASTTGTLGFSWAQNASEADALILRTGSYIIIDRMS